MFYAINLTPQGNFLRVIGGSDNAPEGQLKQPVGIACDSHGLIYVTQMKPASNKDLLIKVSLRNHVHYYCDKKCS